MEFRIADTFTQSLARLTGEEQKAVKTTAFDLQLDPASPGMRFHKLDRARDKNFWSVRVSADLRLIVHRSEGSLLLCYVDHHDDAYAWARARKLETHPTTGAAQLVEVRETIQEIVRVREAPTLAPPVRRPPSPGPLLPLFAGMSDDALLGYGVPFEWLGDVRQATEETILDLADHLPAEAAEALLELATGGKPRAVLPPAPPPANPFDHPDAQRRFRVLANVEELARALEFPWDRWTIFLHPEQRQWVERDYNGPARISGSAGTGKTIVALHRAVHLARAHPDARVLLTTFSQILANSLRVKLRRLIHSEPRLAERLEVHALDAIGSRLYRSHHGAAQIADDATIEGLLRDAARAAGPHRFTPSFLRAEWDQVVDAWQLTSWEAYRDVARLGRKTRLPEPQRRTLWAIFEPVHQGLAERNQITRATLFSRLAQTIARAKSPPFDFAVVDEAQDIGIAHLRFLAALGGDRPNALFFAGDLGQRIFQQPFSWLALGVDIRGRSRTLRVNYRTSHQIRMQADRLLGPAISDVDGNTEERGATVSLFNGPAPSVQVFPDEEAETTAAGEWLSERVRDGIAAHEIGVFVRSEAQRPRACAAVERAGLPFKALDDGVETTTGFVSISTMHLAKGLEFRAVAVLACDDEVVPLQTRIESVSDDSDLREVYDTERHLLYVACTRARDHLLVSGVEPASEFLEDLHSL